YEAGRALTACQPAGGDLGRGLVLHEHDFAVDVERRIDLLMADRAERCTLIFTLQVEARRVAVFQLLGERYEGGGAVGVEGQLLAVIGIKIAVETVRGAVAEHSRLLLVERDCAALEIA